MILLGLAEEGVTVWTLASIRVVDVTDTLEGKNLIGTINPPRRIWIDLGFLRTLPERELRNGWAEAIKIAAVLDYELFSVLEKDYSKVLTEKRSTGLLSP